METSVSGLKSTYFELGWRSSIPKSKFLWNDIQKTWNLRDMFLCAIFSEFQLKKEKLNQNY